MLTEELIEELQCLSTLETEVFCKVVNYAVNFLTNSHNTMPIHEFIQIDQQQGQRLTSLVLTMLHALVQYRTNLNDLTTHITLIKLDKQRTDYLREKVTDNLEELRKAVFREQLAELTPLRRLEWRFQVQLASKNSKGGSRPNIVLNFRVKEGQGMVNHLVSSDFGTVKYLHSQLQGAMRMHQSGHSKMARNSSI